MSEETLTGTLLLVPQEAVELARTLGVRLGQPVVACPLGEPAEAVVAGIRQLASQGVRRLVVLPLCPTPETDRGVLTAIQWASRRWPFLTFHPAAPLTWQEWASLVRETALSALATLPGGTAVLIAGPGGRDPLVNADVARLAHLVSECSEFSRVDHAFLDATRPAIPDALALLGRLDLRDILLVPWPFASEDERQRLRDLRVTVTMAPSAHPAFLELLCTHHQAALADNSLVAPNWDEVLAEIARSGSAGHGLGQTVSPEEEAQLRELDRKINEMLPPQYQGQYEGVHLTSMGSAPLRFGPDGRVAWEEMWTSFCDLALAGGPAHRGTLLEAVPAADALAEPEKYRAVVAEIERGVQRVTGLPVVASKVPGWVGVRCDSEDMAVWLMRAIIVENVMVRREGDVLYLPAGPRFLLQREIKNVVTVLAKTHHYWSAHLAARRGKT
jgi:sirohydrochlorin cobaltochelatase